MNLIFFAKKKKVVVLFLLINTVLYLFTRFTFCFVWFQVGTVLSNTALSNSDDCRHVSSWVVHSSSDPVTW